MIKVLGYKRIAILLGLLALNVGLGLLSYMHFIPQQEVKERQLKSEKTKARKLQANIDDLQIEFEQLEEQRGQFDKLKEDGFFDGQSRRKAELIFKQIQDRSGVISAVASVAAGEFEENEEAKGAEHKILSSPITVKIEAVNDLDVFRYIYLVDEFFPGHVAIDSIELDRKSDVSGTVLRAIASGKSPPLVTANLTMSWRTMIPDDQPQQGGQ